MREDPDFDALLNPGPSDRRDRSQRWTSGVIALAVGLLLAFNAESPRSWTTQLSPNAVSEVARSVAEDWWRVTERAGLTRPRTLIRGLWEQAQVLRWSAARAPRRTQR